MSNQEAQPVSSGVKPPEEPKIRWWSRLSPWLWGLLILIAILVVVATQVPRIAEISADSHPKLASETPSPTQSLSGPTYSQALVAGRNFVNVDLSGALLAHLDLRGTDFQGANAAGAVFAGSLLDGANFTHVNLRGANLRGACLRGAILSGAELAGADFTGADVTGATIAPNAKSAAIGWGSAAKPAVCPPGS